MPNAFSKGYIPSDGKWKWIDGQYGIGDTVEHKVILYAQWTQNIYNITLNNSKILKLFNKNLTITFPPRKLHGLPKTERSHIGYTKMGQTRKRLQTTKTLPR